jgi:N-methylhydantoinase A
LVAFGGAGALHAARLAEALSIRDILVPPAPGNLSAMGLLCADTRHDHARTLFTRLAPELAPALEATIADLLAEAGRALADDGVDPTAHRFAITVDLRYEGQNYELSLPLDRAEMQAAGREGFGPLIERFDAAHMRVYGYRLEGRAILLVNARVTATGATAHAEWPRLAAAPAAEAVAVARSRRSLLVEAGHRAEVDVHRHEALRAGPRLDGAAIVEYAGGTLFVPPGWHGRVDEFANVHLTRIASDVRAAGKASGVAGHGVDQGVGQGTGQEVTA